MKKIQLLLICNILIFGALNAQDCPLTIKRLGGGVNDSKIQANFEGDNLPANIQIKGTDDERFVSEGGVWVSTKKYGSTELTLILKDAEGNSLGECSYNADGTLKPPVTCNVTFVGPAGVQDNGPGGVNIMWNVTDEAGTPVYRIKRKDDGMSEFNEIGTVQGTGQSSYSFDDTSAPAGSSCYQVVADCGSSSTTSPTPFQCK